MTSSNSDRVSIRQIVCQLADENACPRSVKACAHIRIVTINSFDIFGSATLALVDLLIIRIASVAFHITSVGSTTSVSSSVKSTLYPFARVLTPSHYKNRPAWLPQSVQPVVCTSQETYTMSYYAITGIPVPIPNRMEITAFVNEETKKIQLSLFIRALTTFQNMDITELKSYFQIAGMCYL